MVAVGPPAFIKVGEKVLLSTSGASTYIWSPETGLSCTDCPDPVASPAFTTTYTITGLDADGCSDTASITVNVRQPCPFYIPNVFYPEDPRSLGNGLFGVMGQEIASDNFLLRVFSRWGELVFESKDPQVYWDGTFKNKTAEAGVYVYNLEMSTCDGLIKKSGDLTLIR
jgi:gliding motility-associated-like protein